MHNPKTQSDLPNTRHIFRLLVLYRWLSLIPPILSLTAGESDDSMGHAGALLAAAALTMLNTMLLLR